MSRLASSSFLLLHHLQSWQEAVHEMAGDTEFCEWYSKFLQEPWVQLSQPAAVPASRGSGQSLFHPYLLPLSPGGCWAAAAASSMSRSSGCASAPSGKPIQRHLHTIPPGWALQAQGYSCTIWSVGGISLLSFVSEHVLFWHDLMSIVDHRMEKIKIIHRVQQERKAYFLGSKTISRAKRSNAPFTF